MSPSSFFLCSRESQGLSATSVSKGGAFSTGGNILPSHRTALKLDAVDRLVFLVQNLECLSKAQMPKSVFLTVLYSNNNNL